MADVLMIVIHVIRLAFIVEILTSRLFTSQFLCIGIGLLKSFGGRSIS